MELIWHGHSFFEIKGKNNQENVSIATNPFSEEIGLKSPKKVDTDILIVSSRNQSYLNKKIISGNYFLIEDPGEYEIKDIKIKGISCESKEKKKELNTIFTISIEGIKICHMGNFNQLEISSHQLENIFGSDILLIPVGGSFTISGKEAAKIVSRIEPKIVIPMHYKISGLNLDIEDEKSFLRAMGIEDKERIQKLKIKKSDFQRDGIEVMLLDKV